MTSRICPRNHSVWRQPNARSFPLWDIPLCLRYINTITPIASAAFHADSTTTIYPAHVTRCSNSQHVLTGSKTSQRTFAISAMTNRRYVDDTLIMEGKELADRIIQTFPQRITKAQKHFNVTQASIPGLGVIIVGNRRDSKRYVEKKLLAVEAAGFYAQVIHLEETATEDQVISNVNRLNNDRTIHGILVQLPLPSHINQLNVLRTIDVEKDVDGFHPYNMGLHALKVNKNSELLGWSIGMEMQLDRKLQHLNGMDWLMNNVACAPKACMFLLNHYGISVSGKRVVVLGQSPIVGVPMIFLLMSSNAIVSTTNEHCGAASNRRLCQDADIIISAVGKANLLTKDWVKPGAIVLDVGINFLSRTEYKRSVIIEGIHTDPNPNDLHSDLELVGDAYFDDIIGHAGAVTPVPKGVGPLTVAMLLENTFLSFVQLYRKDS